MLVRSHRLCDFWFVFIIIYLRYLTNLFCSLYFKNLLNSIYLKYFRQRPIILCKLQHAESVHAMASFLSSVRSSFGNRETIVKESLLANLSENGKEIQFEQQECAAADAGNSIISIYSTMIMMHVLYVEQPLGLSDCTNSLCTTVEAIFLHGLKDSFLRQTINVIAGEVDRRPEPNFWPPLLVFTHKHTIEQIQGLTQINTDIGFCRAWIRQSLNESLLSSYLANIQRNQTALGTYYKRVAFLRDSDCLQVAMGIIGGIETCVTFRLPYNSSLLNQWTYHPLQMAGLYTPPLRTCPVI